MKKAKKKQKKNHFNMNISSSDRIKLLNGKYMQRTQTTNKYS